MEHKYSVVEVKNVWIEDLFEWFYKNAMDGGGDGSSAIICQNYQEAATLFNDWWMKYYQPQDEWTQKHTKFFHERRENPEHRQVYFGDHDESFIFTDDINCRLFPGEYNFIVREDCTYAYERTAGRLIGIPK